MRTAMPNEDSVITLMGSVAIHHKAFDRKLPGDDAGAFHSAELWYVFGSLEYCWRPLEERDHELSKEMMGYWINFFRTGDPNPCGSPETWAAYKGSDCFVKELF